MSHAASRRAAASQDASAILPFLLITFGMAWGLMGLYLAMPDRIEANFGPVSGSHPLFILAVYAPAIAAVVLVLHHGGIAGLKAFLSRLLLWRMAAGWWAFLLLGIPAVYFLGAALGGTLAGWAESLPEAGPLLAATAFMLVLGPAEEFGWRGFALPLLQRRMAPVRAGLVLGLIWGVWHLPAFYLSGLVQSEWSFMPFLIGSVAVSLILTAMFNAARGSILLAALFHFQLNNPLWPDGRPWDMYLFAAVAAAVVWIDRKRMFSRAGAATDVISGSDKPLR
ncbi:MAG: CPBP family intramembrane metalloprotease [Mesorhizobium sp.]|uniref:CPBP family intramembrane glutamic endopeptidase n=1 Tax=Mesorhizobium sp. TaxID=1871066 RepID=UPI000FEA1036|nr:CPBP family intramembrane glutamic endopeptidase [Mesorhizobium sp.]RWB25644.1 MAG: CPBP family intramembrane metalloprotease [Mesorhizobium sp.]TIT05868.1 MAG: CPBP family intramembrane metalloprotease [Mesorhizobium sp.]